MLTVDERLVSVLNWSLTGVVQVVKIRRSLINKTLKKKKKPQILRTLTEKRDDYFLDGLFPLVVLVYQGLYACSNQSEHGSSQYRTSSFRSLLRKGNGADLHNVLIKTLRIVQCWKSVRIAFILREKTF